ncbi:uncharacterized protein LOC104527966 [Antrostomus carolinensis]|uniref:uncharacterized protein LOC104527966 n=1 Tax=Antrostomus carolinensis TaxID=279965 RepID=UPI0005287701|nr:uncharacterized protein LOC104527966 [Antrostomus carolinensis]
MSSRSSGVALGLSSPLPVQRNSFPALHLLPPRSRSLALLSQEDFFESFSGSFCDTSDVLGADLLDCNCSIADPQLVRRIVSQVEFYLSDENLAKDAFLLKHVQKNKMGFVSIKLLTSFKKVKYLTRDWRLTLYALRFSELLEVNGEGTKVRRRVPIPESLLSIPPSKLLLAWDLLAQEQDMLLPLQKNFLETITRMFSPFGAIVSIRILRPGRKLPSDVRKYTSRSLALDGPLMSPSLLLPKDPLAPTWHSGDFKPSNFSSTFTGSLLTSKVFPPLEAALGTDSSSSTKSPHGCGWGSGVGIWAPWHSSSSPDSKPPPGNPAAAKWVTEPLNLQDGALRQPHGPDGTWGCCSSTGRGELVLQH